LIVRGLAGFSIREARLQGACLRSANLSFADLRKANLSEADLSSARFMRTNLRDTNLRGADLRMAYLYWADLARADLSAIIIDSDDEVIAPDVMQVLTWPRMNKTNLMKADLRRANLKGANLGLANLKEADMREANFAGANLSGADLSGANLTEANLSGAHLVNTNVDGTKVSGSSVYGVNVWDLIGEFEEQKDLIVTAYGDAIITVDNIRVAQFIYLILNNEEIRDVLNTLTSKSVLILGRFAIPERKVILDALRNKLREYNLLPIVFDFDRPTDKDFTETIKTLAGLSYFVIADITNPKSSPLELQATVPDYQIPFVPIIQEGERPFAMMVDLQKKYNWVLDTLTYNSIETLIKALKPAIIDPAIQKHNELRLIKAREPKIRSASDFIDDKGI